MAGLAPGFLGRPRHTSRLQHALRRSNNAAFVRGDRGPSRGSGGSGGSRNIGRYWHRGAHCATRTTHIHRLLCRCISFGGRLARICAKRPTQMKRRPITDTPSAREVEQRDLAFRHYSARISTICAWLSAALGVFALFVVLAGYRSGLQLPNSARINVDSGLSEGLTAAIGSFWVGTIISLFALFFAVIALFHSKRRLRTALFALPAVLLFAIVATQPRWLLAALSYGL